jgi:hypothetical protein
MFLRHYVINGFNATAAARAVGYAFPNVAGPRLVNVSIFQKHLAALSAQAGITAAEIHYRLTRIARSSLGDCLRRTEQGVDLDWEAVLANADLLGPIKMSKRDVTLQCLDRLRALELLGKSQGMFRRRIVEEPEERPIAQAVLRDALVRLRAYQREGDPIVRVWNEATGPAH